MKIFIYYRKNEEGGEPDIAAVRAKSIDSAIQILGEYYNNIDMSNDICELNFENKKNKNRDIIIISDY